MPSHNSASKKSGLVFPVGRVRRLVRKQTPRTRLAAKASVYLAAVLEHVVQDILELATDAAKANKKQRVTSRFVLLAIEHDEELKALFPGHVSHGGVIPFIHAPLLPVKKEKAADK